MFRIDKNLVNMAPKRFTTVMEAFDTAKETVEEPSEELPVEELAEEPVEELTPEPEVELPPEPEGPTPEELAAERVSEIISGAEADAARIVDEANRQAEQIRAEADAQAEQARESARSAGYEAGVSEAKAAVEAAAKIELESKLSEDDEMIRSVIDAIQAERTRMFADIEGEVIKLTLAVAEKIIKLANENDDNVFESIIINALRQMNLEGKLTIRVGVREYDRFFSSGSAVFALGDGTTVTASVIKDPALADGDCIIDSDSGTVNAGIDSQLRYIELAFNGADDI